MTSAPGAARSSAVMTKAVVTKKASNSTKPEATTKVTIVPATRTGNKSKAVTKNTAPTAKKGLSQPKQSTSKAPSSATMILNEKEKIPISSDNNTSNFPVVTLIKNVPCKDEAVIEEAVLDHIPSAVLHMDVPPKDEAMALFDRIDYNGNGFLSLAELDKAVLELYPEWNNKPAMMRAYKSCDTNGDGFVKQREFEMFLRFLVYYNNLWHDFSQGDNDKDRRLTKDEFLSLAAKMEIESPEAAFEEMDQNSGGVVLFDEFCTWMAKNKGEWGVGTVDASHSS